MPSIRRCTCHCGCGPRILYQPGRLQQGSRRVLSLQCDIHKVLLGNSTDHYVSLFFCFFQQINHVIKRVYYIEAMFRRNDHVLFSNNWTRFYCMIALLRNYYQIIFLRSVFMRLRKKQLNTEVRVSQTLVIVALNDLLCILFHTNARTKPDYRLCGPKEYTPQNSLIFVHVFLSWRKSWGSPFKKMPFCQYRDSHSKDTTVLYLKYDSKFLEMRCLYWNLGLFSRRGWRYFTDHFSLNDLAAVIVLLLVIPLRFTHNKAQWLVFALGYSLWYIRLFHYVIIVPWVIVLEYS